MEISLSVLSARLPGEEEGDLVYLNAERFGEIGLVVYFSVLYVTLILRGAIVWEKDKGDWFLPKKETSAVEPIVEFTRASVEQVLAYMELDLSKSDNVVDPSAIVLHPEVRRVLENPEAYLSVLEIMEM